MTSGAESVTANGNDTVLAGSGSDTISAGSGNVSVGGGTGPLRFIGGSGSAAVTLQPGTTSALTLNGAATVNMAGAATVTGGSQQDLYNFDNGHGGIDRINGFRIGTDHLDLIGFWATIDQQVLAGATNTAAGTVLALPDGTQITLGGIHSVTSSIFG